MRRILAITTIRSDYDLMSGLYRLLHGDPEIDLRLLVGGAHLSANYGRSVDLIRADGFAILAEIESLIDGDSPGARLKTASILLQSAVDFVANWAPDLILFAGDREDVLVGAILGTYLHIPTVHFFGGDHESDGHADTAVRHATSKLATAHVVPIEEHKRRLICMGEDPTRIFVSGSIALDKFVRARPMSRQNLFARFPGDKQMEGFALLIYHPVDAEMAVAGAQFENILLSLREQGIAAACSYPNTDPGASGIVAVIRRYEAAPDFWFFRNLEREWFLSLYKQARFIIGNSSSGILEAASVPIPAINVGIRQRGRLAGDNVLFCDSDRESLRNAIAHAVDPVFRKRISAVRNLYGDGNSAQMAYEFIKRTDFAALRPKTEDPLYLWRSYGGVPPETR